MSIQSLLCLGVGLAFTSLASAEISTTAMEQGAQDAVLTFCAQANPAGLAVYKQLENSFHNDVWRGIQRSAAYQRAYTEVYGAFSAARADWALGACVDLASRSGNNQHR
jgi:hypothetical protein